MRTFLLVGLCTVCIIAARSARAATIQPQAIDRLTRCAGVVVEGRVTAVHGDWNSAHTQIYTTVTLDVTDTYKGDLPSGPMQFRYLGGTVGDMTMELVGEPSFAPEEHVFLFLHPQYNEVILPVVGFNEGKFRVDVDARGVEHLVGVSGSIAKPEAVHSVRSVPGSRAEQ
jgi:hypothetical protein